jgi:hypothetical protein
MRSKAKWRAIKDQVSSTQMILCKIFCLNRRHWRALEYLEPLSNYLIPRHQKRSFLQSLILSDTIRN